MGSGPTTRRGRALAMPAYASAGSSGSAAARRASSGSSSSRSSSRGNPAGQGWGAAVRRTEIARELERGGTAVTGRTLDAADRQFLQYAPTTRQGTGFLPQQRSYSGGGGGGRGGGGGGGGGGPAGLTQAQVDWAARLLAAGGPTLARATTLDLPEYQGRFDPSMYNELERNFNSAVGVDRRAAGQAYNDLSNYLTTNYSNAFNNPNAQYATAGQAPGMDQAAMARMMQGQGVSPDVAGAQMEGAAAADQGFSNLWRVLAANEDTAQRNRLNRVAQDRNTTNRALDVAALQGRTGIGLQRGQAQSAWQQQADAARNQIAQQEAMMNWQRANQVTDTNTTNTASYRNQVIQALLGMMPNIAAGVNMPNPNALGW